MHDSGANLVSFKRQDGAQIGSIDISKHKAPLRDVAGPFVLALTSKRSQNPLCPNQPVGQQRLHVSASIHDQVHKHLATQHAVDHALGFEVHLAVVADTHIAQFFGHGTPLGEVAEGCDHRFKFVKDARIYSRGCAALGNRDGIAKAVFAANIVIFARKATPQTAQAK